MAKNHKIGSDNDTPDTVRTQIIGDAAQFMATQWRKHLYPVPYSRVYNVSGTQVRVTVEEDSAASDAAEIERRLEQYSHE